ncbi:ubiquitin-like protein Atg12 [Catenaria anguillulae PL171]|uniref:Ubiquitin-like protein ATG12 n=1 Tax=Catenaria anguillulae PL171 TaxID=765915 RepID=A0A1Y2I022_9FUNG|nr:ubiquitin-like protein Atg12 [Catenaria anguillulae PL171]
MASTAPPAKVIVRFSAIGDAPILRQPLSKVSTSQPFHTVASYLRRELAIPKSTPLYLYVNQSFAPRPDEVIGDLHACFAQTDSGHLVVSYSMTPAWS